jgi:hypothetical protein
LKLTAFKIFTNEIPLGHVTYTDLIELVVQHDVRPEQPDNEGAPQLSDAVWELAKNCWVKNPKHRPTTSVVCDTVLCLLGTTSVAQPVLDPAPPPGLAESTRMPSVPSPTGPHRPEEKEFERLTEEGLREERRKVEIKMKKIDEETVTKAMEERHRVEAQSLAEAKRKDELERQRRDELQRKLRRTDLPKRKWEKKRASPRSVL